jgi:hypothetical protein
MNPLANVPMREDRGTSASEGAVSRDMIEMVVGVDYELHRLLRPSLYLAKQLLRRVDIPERVDHDHAFIANHEAGIRRGR